MRRNTFLATLAIGAGLTIGPAAAGQCLGIDFENYPVDTVITNQYPGVTFQAWPQSCSPHRTVYPHIVKPPGGCSSGTRALGIQAGCPDFSPESLWMHFDELQRMVTFTLGDQASQEPILFYVKAYNFNDELISTQSCRPGYGVHRLVQVGSPGGPEIIEWIEIVSPMQMFETIDDLVFGVDDTAPTARIDSPRPGDCLCEDDIVVIEGLACDSDGSFESARLEYQKLGTSTWTLADVVDGPVCSPGPVAYWEPVGLAHGHYYLRLTVENACGLTSSSTAYVYLDRIFGEAAIDDPAPAETLCGVVDVIGSAHDSCRMCFVSYRVDYRKTGVGPWLPVDPAHATYDDIVINGKLATWDVSRLPRDTYDLRLRGVDECGNVGTRSFKVNVDNSGDCDGCTADLNGNSMVDFDDLLQILSDWGPCPH